MNDRFSAPWHWVSYERFLSTRLPELLAERLPLAGYTVLVEDTYHCRVTVDISTQDHTLSVVYPGLPRPDDQGLFMLDDQPYIVVPIASQEELDQAAVQCAGEQLLAYLAVRMGQPSAEMAWDEAVARAFLPLKAWFNDFLRVTAQRLDTTNWHALHTHLRRILVPSRKRVIAPGQQGRVDPFETPEGPNIGKVFTIAQGAEIRDEKIRITDDRPEAGLGHNAAQIPFLEHDDANRLLMGVNMMRQGLVPPEPEPALVQTGNAPQEAGADFWCGRNLLTAFIAWGEGSTEDGLILSVSCANRLNYPYPAEAGDKLANRHGTKGVVSQILPDDQMPHLADGTPVEIIFSFTGLHTRMNFGQVREAVMGRIARAEGRPVVVPPFQAPAPEEIRARLVANGLPESGMERLRTGKNGPEMPQPSTVGWVYWYRLAHLARAKIRAVGKSPDAQANPPLEADVAPHPVFPAWESGQMLGELEISALRQVGAIHNAREALSVRSLRSLPAAPSTENKERSTGASPYLDELVRRLAAAGIAVSLENHQLTFRFADPGGDHSLRLVRRMPHPWLPDLRTNWVEQRTAQAGQFAQPWTSEHPRVTEQGLPVRWVGAPPKEAGSTAQRAFAALVQANDRMERWLNAHTPKANPEGAEPETELQQMGYLMGLRDQLSARLAAYFNSLLPPAALRFAERQAYSGRAVIAPAVGLRLDQVGLPESIARALFAAQAGSENFDITERMAHSWVIIHRAPAVTPTALVAFHPLLVPDPAIRLHPQACELLNADFDGDQVAVYLPLSEAAQHEAGEKLSVAAHLTRDPQLVVHLLPPHEGIWGLADLSLDQNGRGQIARTLHVAEDRIGAPVEQTELAKMLREVLDREGAQPALQIANALAHLGYARASTSGASLNPFPTSQVPLPKPPAEGESAGAWEDYIEACAEAILSARDYASPNLGPQLLSAAVRQRSRRFLPMLIGLRGPVKDAAGETVIIRHSFIDGRTPQELYASVAGAREGLAKLAFELRGNITGEHVLWPRDWRSNHRPGPRAPRPATGHRICPRCR